MGIWRPIRIEAFDSVLIKYIKWNPRRLDGVWNVDVEAVFECSTPDFCQDVRGDLSISMPEVTGNPFSWKDLHLEMISSIFLTKLDFRRC
jgi:hypothetical protein